MHYARGSTHSSSIISPCSVSSRPSASFSYFFRRFVRFSHFGFSFFLSAMALFGELSCLVLHIHLSLPSHHLVDVIQWVQKIVQTSGQEGCWRQVHQTNSAKCDTMQQSTWFVLRRLCQFKQKTKILVCSSQPPMAVFDSPPKTGGLDLIRSFNVSNSPHNPVNTILPHKLLGTTSHQLAPESSKVLQSHLQLCPFASCFANIAWHRRANQLMSQKIPTNGHKQHERNTQAKHEHQTCAAQPQEQGTGGPRTCVYTRTRMGRVGCEMPNSSLKMNNPKTPYIRFCFQRISAHT